MLLLGRNPKLKLPTRSTLRIANWDLVPWPQHLMKPYHLGLFIPCQKASIHDPHSNAYIGYDSLGMFTRPITVSHKAEQSK